MTGQTGRTPRRCPSRGRKRKKLRIQPGRPPHARLSGSVAVAEAAAFRAGWRVIAAKEFTDHDPEPPLPGPDDRPRRWPRPPRSTPRPAAIRGRRLRGDGPAVAVPDAVHRVRSAQIPPFTTFIAFLGPLLGIAFGFDGDQRRARRGHAAATAVAADPPRRRDQRQVRGRAGRRSRVIFVAVMRDRRRHRHHPAGHPARAGGGRSAWRPGSCLAVAYVGFWLALALLCSVLFRRAATSALVAIAVWLVLTALRDADRQPRRRRHRARPGRCGQGSAAAIAQPDRAAGARRGCRRASCSRRPPRSSSTRASGRSARAS